VSKAAGAGRNRFSRDGREFVITDPATPRPWHNYLCNAEYLVNITQHGLGSSFWQPRGEGLRCNVTEDRDGSGGPRFVYLRDNDKGNWWTVTGAPDFRRHPGWECRIGLGYQINRSRVNGIDAAWRVFVPDVADAVEYWTITVVNQSDQSRNISVFPYLEMHLTGGSTLMDFIAVIGGRYEPGARAVFGINSCVKFPPKFKAFLASDTEVAGATVSRDEFLGHYRDYRNPVAIERGDVHNPEAGTEWLGASLRHALALAPGETRTINCLIGVVESVEEGRSLIGKYLAEGVAEKHFEALRRAADDMCGRTEVKTGDEQFDRWVNVWLKHQLRFVARWGRVIGRGFRDILQDTLGHRLTDPATAKACLLETFSKQYPSGKAIRAWRLPIGILDLQDYADSPSWMIMALSAYLKETGDTGILDERVPFLNQDDPYRPPTSRATVWEHVLLAQRHLLQDTGKHGLSKIHYGDWCDTMNGVGRAGRGESVMLSMQVKWGCDLLAELSSRTGRHDVAREMSNASAAMAEAINKSAWDGAWYIRAFDDNGVPVGSDRPPDGDNGEGRIFLNAQSWALISGVATPERAEKMLESVRRHLDTGYGMALNWPAYTGLKPRIGQMTAMTPGFYENGSVYVHGNCFWIAALAMSGRGNEAWRAMRAILPDTDNKPNSDTEPFVIPNYYIGPNVSRRTQRNLYLSGWRTGSAAWIYQTALEWILGVRADYEGLKMDPHLPDGWTKATVVRPFRGDVYEVTIRSPTGRAGWVKSVQLGNRRMPGTLVTPVGDGRTHRVLVDME
jgi:cellobiose phosphorylase/cellobionic acid phosphorylase